MPKPSFEHDCDGCTFLGTDQRGKDWYVCGKSELRSLIRRYGSDGCEYESGLVAGCVTMTHLERLAARMGFEFNDHEMKRFAQIYIKEQTEYKSIADSSNGPALEDEDLLGKGQGTER